MDGHWTFQIDDMVRTRPVIDDDVAYVGADNGLSVLDADSGERRRHLPFDHWVRTSPHLTRGTVCLFVNDEESISRGSGGTVYALDGRRGVEHWAIDRDDRITGVAAAGDVVCYGCDRQVHAVGLEDGEERWRFDGRSLGSDRDESAVQRLAAAGDVVYAANRGGEVRALDAASGDVRWRFTIDSRPTALVATDRSVYVGSHGESPAAGEPVLYALRADTGEARWRVDVESGLTDPAPREEAVFATTYERVSAIDRDSGEVLWKHRGGESLTNPIVQGDRVYVGTDEGKLVARDVYDGHRKDSRRLDDRDVRIEHLGGDGGLLIAPVVEEDGFTTTLHAFTVPHDADADGADTQEDAPPESGFVTEDTAGDACPSCGADLTGDEAFCPGCGRELDEPACPSCGADLTGDENFCPECGHEL